MLLVLLVCVTKSYQKRAIKYIISWAFRDWSEIISKWTETDRSSQNISARRRDQWKLKMINKIADSIVFNTLKNIYYGYLEVTTFEGETLKFGNPEEKDWQDWKVKQMQPMLLCIFLCKRFENTFEKTQWRKDKQMQPVWLCILFCRPFEDSF